MKAYIRNPVYQYDFPEDMEMILDYLNKHGKVVVSGLIIENLYRNFSDECYCAGWMCVDKYILEEFEEWLTHKEVYFDVLD